VELMGKTKMKNQKKRRASRRASERRCNFFFGGGTTKREVQSRLKTCGRESALERIGRYLEKRKKPDSEKRNKAQRSVTGECVLNVKKMTEILSLGGPE